MTELCRARAPYEPQIRRYTRWLESERGLRFADYNALWRWSVTDLDAFWQSVWDYFDIESPTPHHAVLARNVMPGAQWFPGAQVNFTRQALRHVEPAARAGLPAIISSNERGERRELDWPGFRRQVVWLALRLRALGVGAGDRVAAYLPNTPEAAVALYAVAALGAIWSICAPDMGANAVLDRFRQIEPKVLIACNGVTYGGRDHDRREVVSRVREALPSVEHLLGLRVLHDLPLPEGAEDLSAILSGAGSAAELVEAFEPTWVAFAHPLWIVYSSGTSGLPKPIVQTHGGALINGMMHRVLHYDIGCSYDPNSAGERFLWYSSTGWVMWNSQLSGLLGGTTCVIFDGNPGGPRDRPDWSTLWRFAADEGVSFFGAGAAFYQSCLKAGVRLDVLPSLERIRALGCTGSPLAPEVQHWGSSQLRVLYDRVDATRAPVWWCNIAGGTDAGSFVGGHRDLPPVAGGLQCRFLGVAIEAWNEAAEPVTDEVGELVLTQPLPSMPPFLWGDPDFRRYRESYLEHYPPGRGRRPGGGDADPSAGPAWRHGDWIRVLPGGGCVIYGRSDATLNRHGQRMGTSELYRAIEALPEVRDSMVVDLEYLGRDSWMPLFVVLAAGVQLNDPLCERIRAAIRESLSPRFVPDAIYAVPDVPRTLSGKKQEQPIRRLLLGEPVEKVISRDAMANPECLDWYLALARSRASGWLSPM